MSDEKEKNLDQVLTVIDFCKALKVSRNTFKKLLRAGIIPPPLPFGERCQRWTITDLQEVLTRI